MPQFRCITSWQAVAINDRTSDSVSIGTTATSQSSVIDEAWLIGVAEWASHDSGGVSTEFLAGYLTMLVDAATVGRAPKRTEIDAVRMQGRKAAESGVPVGRGVDLYLSAARRVWDELPAVIRRRDGGAVRQQPKRSCRSWTRRWPLSRTAMPRRAAN